MGTILLHMHMSLDGMVGGPNGELDWIAQDEKLLQETEARLAAAELLMLGRGVVAGMAEFWTAAEHDAKADQVTRDIGRGMNETRKIVYSHKDTAVRWKNAEVHVVADGAALVEDVRRVKEKVKGTIIVYGGARMARTFLQKELVDEIFLAVCPIILAKGLPLFADLKQRENLRLKKSQTYESGATALHYEVVKQA